MNGLKSKRCVACVPGAESLSEKQIEELGQEVPEWTVIDGGKIRREYRFKTYLDGARWVGLIAEIADAEDHHPDVHLYFKRVLVELWTHSVNGLSENDYILAAKLDHHYSEYPGRK